MLVDLALACTRHASHAGAWLCTAQCLFVVHPAAAHGIFAPAYVAAGPHGLLPVNAAVTVSHVGCLCAISSGALAGLLIGLLSTPRVRLCAGLCGGHCASLCWGARHAASMVGVVGV